ncbi:hypothetical protein P171DRAFT_430219 [Karstenula rhodostoma CBS 690.94]|uniref:Uncharacterized protein n=1 Tax=Karstenula rhodostoma CBS 690.94 TaxID=1392251 RepID=A0A9P4UFJ8_9PLEO|nr:hypothetical protein P171DRAFT_430219 [Karstenula rhodostoma CBS 690.94]
MSSGALTNFAQTGSWDWAKLGAYAVSFLARVANCDVEPYTMVLGVQIGQKLPLSRQGEERVSAAVANLKAYRSIGDALTFGYGPTSIVRTLGGHVDGLALVAISAALTEVYNESVAASVLKEILIYLDLQREATPLLQSWLKIVKACAGTLATTEFAVRAEDMMKLHPTETSLPSATASDFHDSWRSRSKPQDIAKALVTLGEISRKKTESVIIVGGGDVGFLAAVAEWLFDMKIVILNSDGRTPIYPVSTSGSPAQVRFIYQDRTAMSSSQNMELDVLQYSRKVIYLKDVSDILWANKENRSLENLVAGRLGWDRCLSSAFGNTYAQLTNQGEIFGNTLGYAARIFKAVATAEPGIDIETRRNWIYYTDAGSGFGYLQHLISRFPELSKFRAAMDEGAAEADHQEARKKYGLYLSLLAQPCKCAWCTPGVRESSKTGWCAVVVVETILKAGLLLSNVLVEPGLTPKRSGFERLYDRQTDARSEPRERPVKSIDWVIEPERGHEILYTVNHRVRSMVDSALGLFSNHEVEIDHDSGCAFVENGICAYRMILDDLAVRDDTGIMLAQIRILPGQMVWSNTPFSRIEDMYVDHPDYCWIDDDDRIVPDELEFGKPSLLLEESTRSLKVSFQLLNSRGRILHILPTYTANEVLEHHGLVTCDHRPNIFRGNRAIGEGMHFQVQNIHGREVTTYRAPPGASAFAALTIAKMPVTDYDVVCNNKCMECALHTAARLYYRSTQPLLIVSY